jgi:divalent metal cation (Fe/Co/Zn/Cd) transporter
MVCQCKEEACDSCTMPDDCRGCNSLGSCCCMNSHVSWHYGSVRNAILMEYFSIGWMTVEVISSIIAGFVISKSIALIAFGGDSVVELISAYAVFDYLRSLGQGNYTKEKVQSKRTEKIATVLLIALIPIISGGAAVSYFSGIKPEASALGLIVALGASIIMPILWIEKKRIGRIANIPPLAIDATESATCFFMSLALLGGLLANYLFGITWSDYIATAIILGFVALEVRESLEEMQQVLD